MLTGTETASGPTVEEADFVAFMGVLPPRAHLRVAEFVNGTPELNPERVARAETVYERVTGHSPHVTLHRREAGDARAAGDRPAGSMDGIWYGRQPSFSRPEDARAALRAFHRELVPHGGLFLDTGRFDWSGSDSLEEFLVQNCFQPLRVHQDRARVRVLAIQRWRCCGDGLRNIYDSHAIS